MNFPEPIFHEDGALPVPALVMVDLVHHNIGESVIVVNCQVNGARAKRITQEFGGVMVNKIPVWHISDRIVADWFAEILEAKYQSVVEGQLVIIPKKA